MTPRPTVSSGPLTIASLAVGRVVAVTRGAGSASGCRRSEVRDAGPGRRRRDLAGEADHPPLRPAVGDDHRALDPEQRRAADPLVVEDRRGSGRCPGASAGTRAAPPRAGTRSRHRSKMKVERPSKNLMTTLPRTASQTTTSAMCLVRSLPSTLPTKRSDRRVEQLGRPLDPGVALALLLADRQQRDARVRRRRGPARRRSRPCGRTGRGSRRSSRGWRRCRAGRACPASVTIWTARAGPVDARQAAEPEDRGGHAGARCGRR